MRNKVSICNWKEWFQTSEERGLLKRSDNSSWVKKEKKKKIQPSFKVDFMTEIIKMLLLLEDRFQQPRRFLIFCLVFLWPKGKAVSQRLKKAVNSSSYLAHCYEKNVSAVVVDCSATRLGEMSTFAEIISNKGHCWRIFPLPTICKSLWQIIVFMAFLRSNKQFQLLLMRSTEKRYFLKRDTFKVLTVYSSPYIRGRTLLLQPKTY